MRGETGDSMGDCESGARSSNAIGDEAQNSLSNSTTVKRLTRRRFIQTAAGAAVGLAIVPMGAWRSQAQNVGSVGVNTPAEGSLGDTPGVASMRIDGYAKVTGQKIYARDYNARDMVGWPKDQWYALYLNAITTTQTFQGIDLSGIPAGGAPTKIIYGDQLTSAQRTPDSRNNRDLKLDREIKEEAVENAALSETTLMATGDTFDKPSAVMFDLIVQRGNQPDFLGQAVALLMFDTLEAYSIAKQYFQFNGQATQIYGAAGVPNPNDGQVFQPTTWYVRQAGASQGSSTFSKVTTPSDTYDAQVKTVSQQIDTYLSSTPGLITTDFEADMRAMDPMFMEPEAGLGWYDATTQTMNVLLGTQSPDGDVSEIASMYGDPGSPYKVSNVTLYSCYPGGGFGGRDKSPFSLLLALCAGFTDNGAPVRLRNDRFEQFQTGLKRHACNITGKLGVTSDMTIQALEMSMNFDGGGRKNLSPYVAQLGALCAGGSYRIPQSTIYAQAYQSQNVSGGSQRGFGGPQAFFAIETAIDDITYARGWDPIAFRRHNALVQGDATVVGGPIDQQLSLDAMLEQTASQPLWANRVQIKQEFAQKGLVYGTGVAMSLQAYGTSGDGVIAAVGINSDGSYTVQSDAVDMGNGSATTLGVVIGPILGANAATVEMGGYTLMGQMGMVTSSPNYWNDPAYTAKTVGSSSACLTGLHQVHVMQQAAQAFFLQAILPAARALWGAPTITQPQTVWVDGTLTAPNTGLQPLSLQTIAGYIYKYNLTREVIAHAYFQQDWVKADYALASGRATLPIDGLSYYTSQSNTVNHIWRTNTVPPPDNAWKFSRTVWAPCVNVVSLTVDKTSGFVTIQNVYSMLNAGKLHVPQLVSGMSQGGVAMAIGWTLLEDMPPGMAGPASGEWNLNRYHVPRYQDVPLQTSYSPGVRSQVLEVLPVTAADNNQGRGIAEAVMCSIAPAISNALRDAVGVRYTSLPITPEKILQGLKG